MYRISNSQITENTNNSKTRRDEYNYDEETEEADTDVIAASCYTKILLRDDAVLRFFDFVLIHNANNNNCICNPCNDGVDLDSLQNFFNRKTKPIFIHAHSPC